MVDEAVEAPEAKVMPHVWGGLAAGLGAVLLLTLLTSALLAQFIRQRPVDLRETSLRTARSVEESLQLSQVPLASIVSKKPTLRRTGAAYYYEIDYRATLPESVSAEGVIRLIERDLLGRGILVSPYTDEHSDRVLRINLGNQTLGQVVLVSVRGARPYRSARDVGVSTVPAAESMDPVAGAEPVRPGSVPLPYSEVPAKVVIPQRWTPPRASVSVEKPLEERPSKIEVVEDATESGPPDGVTESAEAGNEVEDANDGSVAVSKAPEPVQVAEGSSRLAIIVDDGGYGGASTDIILSLDPGLTLSILPNTPSGESLSRRASALGFEIMLHMPMENKSDNLVYDGQIDAAMAVADIRERTLAALSQVPGAVGVNNHTGSKFTEETKALSLFMDGIAGTGLYFVDSRTTPGSRAYDVARAFGIPSGANDLFLDHDNDLGAIRMRFRQLVRKAKSRGAAIGICHFRPNTAQILKELLPSLRSEGVVLVHASELVR